MSQHPPFRFIRKHHNYAYLKKKTIIFVVTYMLLLIRKMDVHEKRMPCQIYKAATGIYVTNPIPTNIAIFSQTKNEKNIG